VTVRDPSVLTCKEVVELLTELLSDALPPADRVRLEQHLLVCPPCTLHLGQVRSTIRLVADLRSAETPSGVIELFRHWKRK